MSTLKRQLFSRGLAVLSICLALTLPGVPATAAPGGIITNGTSTSPFIVPAFLFEPEVPFASLKTVPTWNELEQLLDNPYAVTPVCTDSHGAVPANEQGFPSYCSTIIRRVSPGVALPPLLVHPLNYNPATGEEMRLLNPNYPGGAFVNTSTCICDPTGGTITGLAACTPNVTLGGVLYTQGCVPTRSVIQVSAGSARVTETEIDNNSPFVRDTPVCITLVENPEGAILCGGDPGEPRNPRFGAFGALGYSTPAIAPLASPVTPIPATARLRDPSRALSGEPTTILPRNQTTGAGGLRKPSIRIPAFGGTGTSPNYSYNSAANLALRGADTLAPSNENDYVRGATLAQKQQARQAAMALGKALFWDMQVGSDGVQSCGTCHFTAGVDTRTKNQLNPNHLGGDLVFDLHPPNSEVTAADFPFHKLTDPEIAGDPACTTPIVADVTAVAVAGLYTNIPANLTPTVCNAANVISDTNDVMSSMGVHFGRFFDIPAIGTFLPTGNGVPVLPPDLRSPLAADNIDPIPGFAGASGNDFRRVEPRNTPTIFAAALNFDNFWDGRARHDFNGGSVFGASDPQNHVLVGPVTGNLTATRQIIRFASLASLATGPGLSEFEMSFLGRNWAKIGKKLLQGQPSAAGTGEIRGTVTPLANQLVALDDSLLGPYSNQGGSACAGLGAINRSPGIPAPGKPGLCISYPGLIRLAFYSELWQNQSQHLVGCYTDGRADIHPNQCAGTGPIPILDPTGLVNNTNTADPFDGYVLSIAPGPAVPTDTNQFNQMEANFPLFWGLSIHLWATILVPDDTPFDQFLDGNPDAFRALGEPGEPGLVADLINCTSPTQRDCFTEVGNFKRDPGVVATIAPGVTVPAGGTRAPGTTDPLLGFDIFSASNLSLKNPNFRTGRCGECHAVPTLTDHTTPFTHKAQLRDFIAEFLIPGVERPIEPLGRLRVISGFLLEDEFNSNGQDQVERRIINQSIVPNPVDGLAYPDGVFNPPTFTGAGQSFFDNGVYNIGVRPIGEDIGRGNTDAFGWPLSLAAMALKNIGGTTQLPGTPVITFNDALGSTGGLYEETAQDQQINPGFESQLLTPLLPAYLSTWVKSGTNGDAHPEMDEVGGAPGGMWNTLTDVPIIEGFADTLGPFNPAGVLPESLNSTDGPLMGTWPVVNRVARDGSFKAAQLRGVELTGPYFHNGGKLTLRQVVDFYVRGGDFPITNAEHRDFNLTNLKIEVQSNLSEEEETALIDFLLELTDDRVKFEKAPFDHPEVFVPLDGTAPDNGSLAGVVHSGRNAFLNNLANGMFLQSPAVGATGRATPLPAFMGLSNVRVTGAAADPGGSATCPLTGATSQYCH